MLTPRLSKESARHLHRESWGVRPHLHAHGRRRSTTENVFDEVLTLMKLLASVVLEYVLPLPPQGGQSQSRGERVLEACVVLRGPPGEKLALLSFSREKARQLCVHHSRSRLAGSRARRVVCR